MRSFIVRAILFLTRFVPVKILLDLESIFSRSTGKGIIEDLSSEVIFCLKLIEDEPTIFLDVGANKGNYTKEVLSHYPDLKAYLFEPSKKNIKYLNEEFSDYKNVSIIPSAVSNFKGITKLYSDEEGSGTASLTKRELLYSDAEFNLEEEIEVQTLKDFWKSNIDEDYVDYLKIDVEGHEKNVLEGCGDLIKKIKLIQFEFGGTHVDSRVFFKDFWEFFSENNFELYRLSIGKVIKIESYTLDLECFQTTNYMAKNKRF